MLHGIRQLIQRMSRKPDDKDLPMQELLRNDDLERCLALSEEHPVFIYKHSTACPISWGAADRVASFLSTAPPETPEFFQVLVIESRPISNAIATLLNVQHQSPQLILVKDREAVWTASHHNITAQNIEAAIEQHAASRTP